jgi:hypothetical protein
LLARVVVFVAARLRVTSAVRFMPSAACTARAALTRPNPNRSLCPLAS